ncbi:hypothetical protein HK099_007694 [Clydaea vesicula]|uniref:LicD/FKTN/FKRP nucleotidyltransferase domain-containing protein n=1 Tax=Clydaea vesicula TaxID=447962 RepID=A0AAD5Y2N8_9FUNG|nr:hypothetical protein HK099_007694 [Clydaea vesicula]
MLTIGISKKPKNSSENLDPLLHSNKQIQLSKTNLPRSPVILQPPTNLGRRRTSFHNHWKKKETWPPLKYNEQQSRIEALNTGLSQSVTVESLIHEEYDVIESPKYFKEAKYHGHYDEKFFRSTLTDTIKAATLLEILQGFSEFSTTNNILFWISHGTLLGWYWNQKILPWDEDIDLQVPYQHLKMLVSFNQTYFNSSITKKSYWIDVNPFGKYRFHQKQNVIDARFIDVETGLYIDITALSKSSNSTTLSCKSPHQYAYEDIFPVQETVMEKEIKVWRPNNVLQVLKNEYGEVSMVRNRYFTYEFVNNVWRKISAPLWNSQRKLNKFQKFDI